MVWGKMCWIHYPPFKHTRTAAVTKNLRIQNFTLRDGQHFNAGLKLHVHHADDFLDAFGGGLIEALTLRIAHIHNCVDVRDMVAAPFQGQLAAYDRILFSMVFPFF